MPANIFKWKLCQAQHSRLCLFTIIVKSSSSSSDFVRKLDKSWAKLWEKFFWYFLSSTFVLRGGWEWRKRFSYSRYFYVAVSFSSSLNIKIISLVGPDDRFTTPSKAIKMCIKRRKMFLKDLTLMPHFFVAILLIFLMLSSSHIIASHVTSLINHRSWFFFIAAPQRETQYPRNISDESVAEREAEGDWRMGRRWLPFDRLTTLRR